MKISKQRFFALLILISLTFSLYGCSSSDDEASKDSPQTFLEKYDGTLWREVDDLNEVYYYFQNNLNNPVIKYYNFMGTCYIATIYDTSYFSIEENSISTLKIKEVYSGTENYNTTFSFSEGNMSRLHVENLNGSMSTWDDVLQSSQINPDTFTPICN